MALPETESESDDLLGQVVEPADYGHAQDHVLGVAHEASADEVGHDQAGEVDGDDHDADADAGDLLVEGAFHEGLHGVVERGEDEAEDDERHRQRDERKQARDEGAAQVLAHPA